MFGTVFKSYTGLMANAQAIDLASNNMANSNTIGFKRSSANFGQLISSMTGQNSGNGNPIQIGLGAVTHSISPHFTQGNILDTGISTNLALLGDGFFVTQRNGATEYTRAGNFQFNNLGQLMAPDKSLVQGYIERGADGRINTNGATGDITVDFTQPSDPRATSVIRFITNLSAEAETGQNYTTVMDVYDQDGTIHKLTLNATKTANDGEWSYQMLVNDDDITLDAEATGTLQFDENGLLSEVDGLPISDPAVLNKTITLSGVAGGDLAMQWDLVNTDTATPSPYFTNYSAYSNTGTQYQDGFGSGDLQKVDFLQDGTMMGFYTNGDTIELAKLNIVHFDNVHGLRQSTGGYFRQTTASGEPTIAAEGTNTMLSNAVEVSNVDVAEELTSLIIHQRGYQGNSKAITTADQVIQEILGLKR